MRVEEVVSVKCVCVKWAMRYWSSIACVLLCDCAPVLTYLVGG